MPPEIDVNKQVDEILKARPAVQKLVKENRIFLNKVSQYKIEDKDATVKVWGVKDVNLNAILKNNIYNRTVWTVEKICGLHRKMSYEQLKKNLKKKQPINFNYLWILVFFIIIIVAFLFIIFILPQIGAAI